MRTALLVLPLLLVATAAPAAPRAQQPIEIPPELTDPATAEKIGNMMEAMSKAFLDLPIGEIEAAAEGRPVTAADRSKKIRDVTDPVVLDRQIAQARPMFEQSMKAFARALPAMTKSLSQAANQMERAMENMPRPDYPRR